MKDKSVWFTFDGHSYPRWCSTNEILTKEEIVNHFALGEAYYKLHKMWLDSTCPGKDGQRFGKDDLVIGGPEEPIKEELLPIRKWIPAERNYDKGFAIAPKGYYFTPRGFSTSPIYDEKSAWKVLDVTDSMVVVKKLGTLRTFWSGGEIGAELETYVRTAKEETAISREEFTKNWKRTPADLEYHFVAHKKKEDPSALPFKVYDYHGKPRMSIFRRGVWIDMGIIESEADLRDKKANPKKYVTGAAWGKDDDEETTDKSKDNFPYDWIKPGEFRYCQCGRWLIPIVALKCGSCSVKWTEQREMHNRPASQKEWMQTHAALVKERNELASKRRAEGLPPLFWMKEGSKLRRLLEKAE